MISSNYWCLHDTYILRLFVMDGFSYWNYLMNMFLADIVNFFRKHTLVSFNRKLQVVHIKDTITICLLEARDISLFLYLMYIPFFVLKSSIQFMQGSCSRKYHVVQTYHLPALPTTKLSKKHQVLPIENITRFKWTSINICWSSLRPGLRFRIWKDWRIRTEQ